MPALIEWISNNWALVMSVLFGLSEVLAMIPGLKSNSVFQLIFNVLKSLVGKPDPK